MRVAAPRCVTRIRFSSAGPIRQRAATADAPRGDSPRLALGVGTPTLPPLIPNLRSPHTFSTRSTTAMHRHKFRYRSVQLARIAFQTCSFSARTPVPVRWRRAALGGGTVAAQLRSELGTERSGSEDRCMSVGVRTAIFCCRSSSQIWNTEKVDDRSCREVRWHQGFAELITVEKNRCIPMIDPGTQSPRFRARSGTWQGQFQGQSWGQRCSP